MQLSVRLNGFPAYREIISVTYLRAIWLKYRQFFMTGAMHSNFSTRNFVKSTRYVVHLDTIPQPFGSEARLLLR